MSLFRKDVHRLLPGRILQIDVRNGEEFIEECDKLRVLTIMTQSQNWNCTPEEAAERIKQSSEEHPFSIGSEKFWYEVE